MAEKFCKWLPIEPKESDIECGHPEPCIYHGDIHYFKSPKIRLTFKSYKARMELLNI